VRRMRSREVVSTSSQGRQNELPVGRRFYGIAGLTVQVDSDLPITDTTFEPKFATFEVAGPGTDTILVRQHFGLPPIDEGALGSKVYGRVPWVIYSSPERFTYIMGEPDDRGCIVFANPDHTVIDVFNSERREVSYREGDMNALTMMPTDQIVLARVLADRRACFLHSCGVIVDGRGLLFVGHSGAGKSTIMNLLAEQSEPLCDDRNIVRMWDEGTRVHGCWSHGEVPIVSAASAPLAAVLFLRQATTNRLVPLTSGEEILRQLLPCVIKPLVTADWWERTLDVVADIVKDVPCYSVEFDKSGAVVALVRELVAGQNAGQPAAGRGPS
jgi:hypothetical protein